jgi:hypothetical protein
MNFQFQPKKSIEITKIYQRKQANKATRIKKQSIQLSKIFRINQQDFPIIQWI